MAMPAPALAARAEPPLKPNQPTHSMPAGQAREHAECEPTSRLLFPTSPPACLRCLIPLCACLQRTCARERHAKVVRFQAVLLARADLHPRRRPSRWVGAGGACTQSHRLPPAQLRARHRSGCCSSCRQAAQSLSSLQTP